MQAIWVVDDDRSIRWVLEKALTRAQMPVRLFEKAEDVVTALRFEEPSVVLSDIRMPDMSGVELLAKIKERNPQIPVIIRITHRKYEVLNLYFVITIFSF
jgi:two-component system nitrogen regulation response regulator GlnG